MPTEKNKSHIQGILKKNGKNTTLHNFVLFLWRSHLKNSCFGFYQVSKHKRTGNFLPEGAVHHLPKNLSKVAQIFSTKQSSTKRNEGHTMQQHRAYWHMKVARYSFSGSIPSKFERKLRRHKQTFRKINTSCIR